MRNEVYRIIDFVNGTDFYKMNEIKRGFKAATDEAKKNNFTTDQFLELICGMIDEFAGQYQQETADRKGK